MRAGSPWGEKCGWRHPRSGKSEEKKQTPKLENQPPIAEQRVLVADSFAKERAETGLQGPFFYLTGRETLCQFLDGGGVCVGVSGPLFVLVLESAAYKDQ